MLEAIETLTATVDDNFKAMQSSLSDIENRLSQQEGKTRNISGRQQRGRPKVETNPITRQRITEVRERNNYSKVGLAKMINVDVSALRKWENGKLSIPEYHLESIAQVCKAPLDWLKGESLPDKIQDSINILKDFNPDESKNPVSAVAEAESLTIIYALKMCGYSISDISNKGRFSNYMTKAIKNVVEIYISTSN